MFAEMGLRITIQTNLKVADFLDVTLNLSTRSFYPFRKPSDRPVYIHKLSNHPPNIIKNPPASISRHLTDISSDKASFADAKPLYDNALKASGFSEEAEYIEDPMGKRKNRPRKFTMVQPSVPSGNERWPKFPHPDQEAFSHPARSSKLCIVENARQSHTWQWASGHIRSRSEECMWRVLGGWRKLRKITRFSFPLLLKRKTLSCVKISPSVWGILGDAKSSTPTLWR